MFIADSEALLKEEFRNNPKGTLRKPKYFSLEKSET